MRVARIWNNRTDPEKYVELLDECADFEVADPRWREILHPDKSINIRVESKIGEDSFYVYIENAKGGKELVD